MEAELIIDGNPGDKTTVLYVSGAGDWQAEYNHAAVPAKFGIDGCLEIILPKASCGTLKLTRR